MTNSQLALTEVEEHKFPCPVCLVPGDQLVNLSTDFPLRTSSEMERIYQSTKDLNIGQTDEILKAFGLRDVEAISWDRLHADHGGLFSDHIWEEVKIDAIPPWSGLNHFNSIIKTGEFSDGSKYENMSKVNGFESHFLKNKFNREKILIFSIHNIFTKDGCPRGYQLLKLMCSYLELDMYASLTVHTETTIQNGRKELLVFEKEVQKYMELNPSKSWSFPKAHTHKHMFNDVQRKGATQNYNTKPNEKCHGAFNNSYKFITNFKNVAPQILRFDHADLVATMIRDDIDYLDQSLSQANISSEDRATTWKIIGTDHVSLGSPCTPISFSELE
ncbi:uncharacterized protein LACBIDRAFT_306610 [Laccaria bicolor S238N-H82]|uniref:Predicted protein n=1 Tax=Laccaria bicolor (strain S238N-H82 / ATCC MYA-4686) TaxID=486041 RepID=B0DNF1_LACBS|nr:uncharacterized protein LACBIDRAFT_306610 [Laccaria bicolor S238N-H82]EDR03927.1 predicted protein [Laccaria bicolor S238N-H82]|eukprot:XP_001885495.1 predicted protein [Laccaria bicolor S238N-H82]